VLGLGRALVEVVSAAGGGAARASAEFSATAFAASSEQDQVTAHHFSHILFLTTGFIVPGTGLQSAFDINFSALLQIFPGNFGEPLPEHDVVPLGAILPFACFILESLVGGDGQLGHGRALRRVFDFGVLPQIADQLNSVETFSSHRVLLCRGSL